MRKFLYFIQRHEEETNKVRKNSSLIKKLSIFVSETQGKYPFYSIVPIPS